MRSLQEISDRLDIEDVLAAYADAIDSRDFAALDAVFTPDAHIDYTAFGGIAGDLPTIKAFLAQVMHRFAGFQHLLGSGRIIVDGDRATARTPCFNPTVVKIGDRPEEIFWGALWYVDELVRTPSGWRIARKSEQKNFAQGMPLDFAEWMARDEPK